jgi:hypothetical protein
MGKQEVGDGKGPEKKQATCEASNKAPKKKDPVMLLVDVANTILIPGSDYDNHYKLGENVSGEKIVGKIDLNKENLPQIASEFIEKVASYNREI